MQVVGGVGRNIAVDIVGIAVPAVACIGEGEAAEGAVVVIAVDLGDVTRAVVGDGLLGEGVGAGTGGHGLQAAEGVVGVGHGGGDAAVDAGAFGEQASESIEVEGALYSG